MDRTYSPFGSAIEWIVAAALIVLTFTSGSIILRELRHVSATLPVIARESVPAPAPAGVPPRAVSVPVLLFSDGKAVRIGDTVSQIAARLGREAETGTQSVEPTPLGDRLTRFYEHHGARFVLVFEAFTQSPEARVAAIYLH